MQVILLENIMNLGKIGDLVKVKNGYGRNFLLPEGKALRASKENIELVNKKKSELNKKNEEAKIKFKEKASKIKNKTIKFNKEAKENSANTPYCLTPAKILLKFSWLLLRTSTCLLNTPTFSSTLVNAPVISLAISLDIDPNDWLKEFFKALISSLKTCSVFSSLISGFLFIKKKNIPMLTMINMLIKIISNDSIYLKYTIFIKTQFINEI